MNSEIFTILPSGWRDLRAVLRIEHECFGDDAWPALDILFVLLFPGIVRLKVVTADQIVGFASCEERDGAGWITTIGILPTYRRRGLGRALLAACEENLSKFSCVRLCVRRSNLAAQQLYLETGYVQIDTWRRYYNGGEDAFVMEKVMMEKGR
jgi:ribosomal-protein-alanine N-acetyltransferase